MIKHQKKKFVLALNADKNQASLTFMTCGIYPAQNATE